MSNESVLAQFPLTHAESVGGAHLPDTRAVRYVRLLRRANVNRIVLPQAVYGRWTPSVPTHPARLGVSILNQATGRWERCAETTFPADPMIRGEHLMPDQPFNELERHFAEALKAPPRSVEVAKLATDHLRIECDEEHPVYPNHGECGDGGGKDVPFGILDPVEIYGEPLEPVQLSFTRPSPLAVVEFGPKSLAGITVRSDSMGITFVGPQFWIGFSLRRPLLLQLGWDTTAGARASDNRLVTDLGFGAMSVLGGISGPLLRTLRQDHGAHNWGGRVSVSANRVSYLGLHCAEGVEIDASFVVEAHGVTLEIVQRVKRPVVALEFETWRLAFNLRSAMTGCATAPISSPGRTGAVALPLTWAGDSAGGFSWQIVESDGGPVWTQVESYRAHGAVTGGVVLAERPGLGEAMKLHPGERRVTFALTPTCFQMRDAAECTSDTPSLARGLSSLLACFRPEHRGFSNNSASVNCHLSQMLPTDVTVTICAHRDRGVDPIAMARFTIGRALRGGGGYGQFRSLFTDTDPNLICAAGRLHQVSPDCSWLKEVEGGLQAAIDRVLATLDDASGGLAVCGALSGNSGSHRWSCNAMDIIGFGHIDAYVNALTYRALRNASALSLVLLDQSLARRCDDAANRLRDAYASMLLNPITGWVAGWRSRDGELHDYGFTWINGPAVAFGLLNTAESLTAISRMEALRERLGLGNAEYGIPLNLLPIQERDHLAPQILKYPQASFEMCIDGTLSAWPASYYLRALSAVGLRDNASRMASDLEKGFAAGRFTGPIGSGHEWRSWSGLPAAGYEGTLIGCCGPLYAIAVERGVIQPTRPEWWLDGTP